MKEAILTITPNPALDISGFVRKINVNEKTYVHGEKRSPGGSAINVARILHRLQVPVLASGFLGGSIGEEVQKLLELEGVQQQFIKTEASTRINVTIANKSDHRQTRFSFAGPEIKNTEIRELMKIVSKHRGAKTLVVGGSLPPHFQVQDLNRLIQRAQQQKMDVVVDCPGLILKEIRASGLLLIKPNLDEFRIMTGSRVTTVSQVLKKAGGLLQTASYICVSSVEEGASWK
ncbi:MAG: hypothetical protein OM95_14865 [Bdellovibrio sp. ArHS]|uniref:1-phosphofructokinase family hexose kinase n=1 Tax=Bdellovibrio sp. ArHS TaxID=1569284 RepID=UPI00058367C3|nr:PfkB family carbohydrate kinase [Bdellovibrio sp. ArHS]KHD87376.1 MAG: hypothetical protein OM95_14865 [Bdellovibrio sp. ArHS]